MPTTNAFTHPDRCGVTVVGTATVRLFPDAATIAAAVSRSEPDAKTALATARTSATDVQAYLKAQGIRNYSASRITLVGTARPPTPGDTARPPANYQARIGFTIRLADLDQVEPVVAGLIDAGANELLGIGYQSSVIAEARNDARRQAVLAARDKAHLYCQELGVTAGRVLAIQEIVAAPRAAAPTAPGQILAGDPTELSVGSTVEVTFEILRDDA